MSSPIPINPKFQAFDADGNPLSGGKVHTYETGTTTDKTTYSDAALSTPNANPIILDSRGECDIYCEGKLKIVLKTSADVTVWTMDALPGTHDQLTDADNDTKIQVEESADEDTIRFDTAGTEHITLDSSGNLTLKATQDTVAMTEGLTIHNLSTTANESTVIQFRNSDTLWEDYGNAIFANVNTFTIKGTNDGWAANSEFILAASPDTFQVLSNDNAGYFELNQVHTSSDGSITGGVRQWIFQDDDMADDATVALPTSVQGIVIANAYGNSVHANGIWSVLADGTSVLIAGNNAAAADTDTDLCVYDTGSGATIKNRTGGAAKIRVVFLYY